jgi:hypothetical protein
VRRALFALSTVLITILLTICLLFAGIVPEDARAVGATVSSGMAPDQTAPHVSGEEVASGLPLIREGDDRSLPDPGPFRSGSAVSICGSVGASTCGGEGAVPVVGIPVRLYREGSTDPVGITRTDGGGRYCFYLDADAGVSYAVEASWCTGRVRILDAEGSAFGDIAVRSPREGFDALPPAGAWMDLVFDDDDAESDYLLARSLFENFEPAHAYVNETFGYSTPQVTICIHCPDIVVPEHRFGKVFFGSEVRAYPVPEGDQVWHEFGHAVHYFNSEDGFWKESVNRSFKEGWACYFGYDLSPGETTGFDTGPDRNFGQTDPRYTDEIRRGMVYAGIFRDLSATVDLRDGDAGGDRGPAGDRAIWSVIMDADAADIDDFFGKFVDSADISMLRAVNAIYAAHGLISPAYRGTVDGSSYTYVPLPGDGRAGAANITATVRNGADHPLDFELQWYLLSRDGTLLSATTIGTEDLCNLTPGGTGARVTCELPLDLPEGSYRGIFALVPHEYNNVCEQNEVRFLNSHDFVDWIEVPLVIPGPEAGG